MSENKYRDRGAIGALLDEYEKAVNELKVLIQNFTPETLEVIVDSETEDEDCRSIQTILSHVVSSGYAYVVMIRQWKGEELEFKAKVKLGSAKEYCDSIDEMFEYNVALFDNYPDLKLEEYEDAKKIKTRWGQSYDVDQLLEHAIVHILRHRRQIERFLIKMDHGI